jgi:hypothetical protein
VSEGLELARALTGFFLIPVDEENAAHGAFIVARDLADGFLFELPQAH